MGKDLSVIHYNNLEKIKEQAANMVIFEYS